MTENATRIKTWSANKTWFSRIKIPYDQYFSPETRTKSEENQVFLVLCISRRNRRCKSQRKISRFFVADNLLVKQIFPVKTKAIRNLCQLWWSTCVIFVVFSYSSGFFLKHEFFLLNFFSRKSSTLKALSFSRTKTTGGQIEFAPEDLT